MQNAQKENNRLVAVRHQLQNWSLDHKMDSVISLRTSRPVDIQGELNVPLI